MRYELVCLDAGFTLLNPRRTLADALRGVLAVHGVVPSDQQMREAWHAAEEWFWEEYHRPDNETWGHDELIEQTWRRYHDVMLRALGVSGRHELIDRVLTSQFSAEAWELYPDVLPALGGLRAGAPDGASQAGSGASARPTIAVISDWGSRLPEILDALGLTPYLDFVLASGASGVAKPNPAFFRMALERAGVAAGRAVMVGDSYEADVLGARSAGMDGVLLVRDREVATGAPVPEAVDVPVIHSLLELVPTVLQADAAPAAPIAEGGAGPETSGEIGAAGARP
jgi:putative hydrolase of the HAD superfamily